LFGQLAAHLDARHGLKVVVTWGPAEQELAAAVVKNAAGHALPAPPTTIEDLVALAHGAALVVAGDTGPLHLAAAIGTPVAGIFGPTDPRRNGPWPETEWTISRFAMCRCHHKRRCRQATPCLDDISVREVCEVVDRRLAETVTRG
jgi:ADP-heptose:LPS heptosyltransferase